MSNKKKKIIRRSLVISSIVLFVGCVSFLIYYLVIQPAHSRQVTEKYRKIYYSSTEDSDYNIEDASSNSNKKEEKLDISLDKKKKGEKDSNGILLKFSKLLEYNSDIKGWLNIPGTNIDYPVMQAFNGSDYYLTRDLKEIKTKTAHFILMVIVMLKSHQKTSLSTDTIWILPE